MLNIVLAKVTMQLGRKEKCAAAVENLQVDWAAIILIPCNCVFLASVSVDPPIAV